MINVRALTHVPPEEWTALVERLGGNPLHVPQVTEPDYGRESLRFLTFDQDQSTVACGLAYRVARTFLGVRTRKRWLHLPTPLALVASTRPEQRTEIYASLIEFGRRDGCSGLIIHSRYGESFADFPLFKNHILATNLEFVVDCRRPWETILAGMHKEHRKNVRRVERNLWTLETDNSMKGLLSLRALQKVSEARSAARGGGFFLPRTAYLHQVYERVVAPGLEEILFAKQQGELLAGMAYIAAARKGLTVRSGSTPRGYATGAMYLLQSAVLRRSLERGLEEVNIGGVPQAALEPNHPQHGLLEFKRGFGTEMKQRATVRMAFE